MFKKITENIKSKFSTDIFKNSAWGIVSNIIQNILLSVFFIIIARQYNKDEFANYIIANTIYSFILGFSTLGLGHWFIREIINTEDKVALLNKFFKMQFIIGIAFYFISLGITFLLYQNPLIRSIAIILSINIIFDNIIYVIKYLNISALEQRKSFVLLSIEALLKCLSACALFFFTIPILYLSIILIALRFITLNLFITYGSSKTIKLADIIFTKINFKEIKSIVAANWSFVVIGSLSVVNWRIGNIFVSKYLTSSDVANYEVSFKLLSMAYILPVIVATSIYPKLINALKNSFGEMQLLYQKVFVPFAIFGLLAFTFVFSYADYFIPLLFGDKFGDTALYCKQMFLVMLIFPTFLLQADVLITLKLEKLDMLCNVISILINISLCFIGLHYFKNLAVVNYAIFSSILVFQLVQDFILIKHKVTTFLKAISFYLIMTSIILVYYFLSFILMKEWLFFVFWLFGALVLLYFYYNKFHQSKTVI
jgi:O-antigen/teichoic acid export membrane protein